MYLRNVIADANNTRKYIYDNDWDISANARRNDQMPKE